MVLSGTNGPLRRSDPRASLGAVAAQSRSFAEPGAEDAPAALTLPGARTLRSSRFRTVLALALILVGAVVLGYLLVRQANDPKGQWAFDFATYYEAAGQMASGQSPYAPVMFEGPIAAQGDGAQLYKYPPPLAQLLVPLAGLPMGTAALVYFGDPAGCRVWRYLAGRARRWRHE